MERVISGITVTVRKDGQLLDIQNDGYLGKLSSGQVLVDAWVEVGEGLYGFEGFLVDGKKNTHPLKPRVKPGGGIYYQAKIQVMTGSDFPYTAYPNNNLRLLGLKPDGLVQIWEIAVVSQGGDFFLTSQQVYKVCCYRDGNELVCPGFKNWPQMMEFIRSKLSEDVIGKLAPVNEYQPEPGPSTDHLGPNEGLVLWFNQAQGLGAILTKEGPARVHWSQIEERQCRAFLEPGWLVSFRSLEPINQEGRRPTGFKKEASGVKPLPVI